MCVKALPRFLQALNWADKNHVLEMHRLLATWAPLTIEVRFLSLLFVNGCFVTSQYGACSSCSWSSVVAMHSLLRSIHFLCRRGCLSLCFTGKSLQLLVLHCFDMLYVCVTCNLAVGGTTATGLSLCWWGGAAPGCLQAGGAGKWWSPDVLAAVGSGMSSQGLALASK